MDISEKLKTARDSLGLKQEEMAKKCGLAKRSWQRYEQGDGLPTGSVFNALTDLGFNLNWFFDDSQPMHKGDQAASSQGMAAPPRSAAQGQDITDAVNVQELLNMTAEVLVSDTVYRPALAANIKAFHRSIALEHDNKELRGRIDMMEQRMTAMEQRLADAEVLPKKMANG